MKVTNRTVWKADDGGDLLSRDGDGRFYVHVGSTSKEELAQLREAIALALAEIEVAK